MRLTPAQLLYLCRNFPDPHTAAAIALAESAGDPLAHNTTPPDDSYGLWQINMIGTLGAARKKAFNLRRTADLLTPNVNAYAAWTVSAGGTNWRPWTTFVSGAYLHHLPELEAATMPAPGTADAVIAAALTVVGQVESPAGSNICPITRELDATFPPVPLSSGGTSTRGGTSWCGSFTFWALWKGGVPVDPAGFYPAPNGVGVRCFYCPGDIAAWKQAGRWLDYKAAPPKGALVFYDWQNTHGTTSVADHVGLVTDVLPDGTIVTVEGNTSPAGLVSDGGMVCTFGPGQMAPARPRSSIVGYGLPVYSPTTEDEDPMTYLGMLADGSYFVRGSGTARRVNAEELAGVYAGLPVQHVAAGSIWETWVQKELAAYDKAVG